MSAPEILRWAAAGQKGGAGKSTLCASLAWEAYQRGWRVLVVDGDTQGSCRTWAAEGRDRGRRLAYDPAELPARGRGVLVLGATENLTLAWVDAAGGEHESSLAEMEARFAPRLVLIDVPKGQSAVQTAALEVVDLAFLPCSQAGAETSSLLTSADALRAVQTRRPELAAVVVLNKFRPTTRLGGKGLAKVRAAGLPLAPTVLLNHIFYEEVLDEGRGPRGAACREVRSLFNDLRRLTP